MSLSRRHAQLSADKRVVTRSWQKPIIPLFPRQQWLSSTDSLFNVILLAAMTVSINNQLLEKGL